jgi:hypothetical protein
MGMHSYVQGIKPADEKFREMFAIYKACEKNNVSIPKEVEEFFAGKEPDEAGVVVNLKPSEKGPVQEYRPEYDTIEGFEVDLRKLPPDVKIIRFINSY